MECNTGRVINLGSLYQRFQGLTDKRKAKGKRYRLEMILLGMFLAKLCGEDKPSGIAEWVGLRREWLAEVLSLKRKAMPSHHTYRRILAEVVDEDEFEELAGRHHRRHGEAGYHVVLSMDGKVIRGTIDLEASDGLCLLAVFLPGEGITLAQIALESRQNEIVAAPILLDFVDLRLLLSLMSQREVEEKLGRKDCRSRLSPALRAHAAHSFGLWRCSCESGRRSARLSGCGSNPIPSVST